MITSKQIVNLSEKWVQPVKSWHGRSEVFLNPDSTDIKELYLSNDKHYVRFLANSKTKGVYAWNGFTTIHYEVANSVGLGSEYNKKNNFNLLCGTGSIKSGKILMLGESTIDAYLRKNINNLELSSKKYLEDIIDTNWNWLNPYVNYFNYFTIIRKAIG
jgi:hypothetical protein